GFLEGCLESFSGLAFADFLGVVAVPVVECRVSGICCGHRTSGGRYRYICLCLYLCFFLGTRIANRIGNRLGFFWLILGPFWPSTLSPVFRSNAPSFLNFCPGFLHLGVSADVVVTIVQLNEGWVFVVIILQFGYHIGFPLQTHPVSD